MSLDTECTLISCSILTLSLIMKFIIAVSNYKHLNNRINIFRNTLITKQIVKCFTFGYVLQTLHSHSHKKTLYRY